MASGVNLLRESTGDLTTYSNVRLNFMVPFSAGMGMEGGCVKLANLLILTTFCAAMQHHPWWMRLARCDRMQRHWPDLHEPFHPGAHLFDEIPP